jgi:hypothetical protein
LESISEVQVIKGVIPAEYGQALSGNVNVITNSGTNEYHGSVFYNYQGAGMGARHQMTTSKPNFVWNQFGGSMGGPILRDRLFIFAAFEGYRESSFSFLTGDVPTQLLRQRILAALPFPETQPMLEQNPLLARGSAAITVARRSGHLHAPYSGDLFVRWIGSAAIGVFLAALVLFTAIVFMGYLISDWPISSNSDEGGMTPNFDWFKLQVVYPACLWLVVIFFAVVRFLSYLDLRIRHEGWEVELLMRAEAQRLATQIG